MLVNHVKCEWVDRHPGFVHSANELVSHESKLLFVFCAGSQRFKFLRLKAWSASDLGTSLESLVARFERSLRPNLNGYKTVKLSPSSSCARIVESVSVPHAAARRGNDGMNGLPKVWRSDLQPTLEMLSQGVIFNDETGHRLCATCFPGDACGIAGMVEIV